MVYPVSDKEAPAKIALYFHGIGEDAGDVIEEAKYIRSQCKISVVVIEYPGYGVHWDQGICTDQ